MHSLAFLLPLILFAPLSEIRGADVRTVRLSADVHTPDGKSPAARIQWRSDFDGTLYVWAANPGHPVDLVLSGAKGRVVERDESDGLLATRHVQIEVTRDSELELYVTARERTDDASDVTVTLIPVVETDATRAAAQHASAELAAISSLPPEVSRIERLSACIDALLAVERPAESALVVQMLGEARTALEDQRRPDLELKALEPILVHEERVLPPDSDELQVMRFSTAFALASSERFDEGQELFERCVAGWIRGGFADSLNLQRARGTWASLLQDRGEHSRALELQTAAFEVLKRTRPEDDFDRLALQMNAGTSLLRLRDFDAACSVLRAVVATCERSRPEEDPFRLRAEMNLGTALHEHGDVAAAGECFEHVAAVRERLLPPDHPDVLRARMNLAIFYEETGDVERALGIEQDLLERLLRTVGQDDPTLQLARRNLANSLEVANRYDEARALLDEVSSSYARTRAPDDAELRDVGLARASILKKLGDLTAAEELERALLAAWEEQLPRGHPQRVLARRNLAWTLVMHGNREGAEREIDALVDELTAALDEAAGSGSVREADERAFAQRPAVSALLSLCSGAGYVEPITGKEGALLKLVESIRSAGLRVAAARKDAAESLASELRDRASELTRLVAEHAPQSEIASAQRGREALEREIAKRASRSGVAQLELIALGPDEAALVFVSYERHRADASVPGGLGRSEQMCVFVATSRGVTRIELGPLARIVELVERWRAAIGVLESPSLDRGVAASTSAPAKGGSTDAGEELARCLFGPLEDQLRQVTRVTVVPDDVLCLVPIDALPCADRLAGDRWAIRVRPTLASVDSATARSAEPKLLALGAIDFDARTPGTAVAVASAGSASVRANAPTRAALRTGGVAGFGPLPASGSEVHAIAELYTAAFGPTAACELIEGSRATKPELEARAPSSKYLHLATHGFVLEGPLAGGADAWNERVRDLTPLLACGFALAGANVAEDVFGRLTSVVSGEELASLDLSSCDLAVLSACETSIGVRRAGQGIAGLQRALHMAGVRSAITSLWRVPDEATKELMVDFYRRLWIEKKPKWQALWEAKTALRDAKDERGAPRYTTRDWAAWVLTGAPD